MKKIVLMMVFALTAFFCVAANEVHANNLENSFVNASAVSLKKDANVAMNFCEKKEIKTLFRMLGYFLLVARVLVPILIVVYGMLDIFKAVTDGKGETLKKQLITVGVRILVGIVVFSLPQIISAVISVAGSTESQCMHCAAKPTDCK